MEWGLISSLELYDTPEATLLRSLTSASADDITSHEKELLKLTQHAIPDLWVGASALLSEWYIANGHFSKALALLRPLCKVDDVFTQQS